MARPLLSTLAAAALLLAPAAGAVDVQGLVSFQGQVIFNEPIPGMDVAGVRVSIDPATEATGNGVRCSVLQTQSDDTDAFGLYPNAGSVTAELRMERGGPQQPEGACLVTLRASAYDGASTTAHGSTTMLVSAAEIGVGPAPPSSDRAARVEGLGGARAGVQEVGEEAHEAARQVQRHHPEARRRGGAGEVQGRSSEPMDCDPGEQVDAVLALAHGGNDQQRDVASGEAVDLGRSARRRSASSSSARPPSSSGAPSPPASRRSA